ncbi:hypothetical protein [Pseudobutyrivibrio ruminis]|uniref:Uncharacterized protein n=1 Tax=Pseudobutyrivibrio ruminis TaxID=46206 RepID=A0A2G3DT65_9FIRM|nr:hypothetical protein [Pseudobutyrivibrio ruminis]PHU34226.1 hypothetical protein CSX01_11715 [Pseudobutyrivibrio ruminis]
MISEKLLYKELFEELEPTLTDYDDIAWGEELFEYPIYVLKHGRSSIPEYKRIGDKVADVGLITVNPDAVGMLSVVPGYFDPVDDRVYIKENQFNDYWRVLRNSVQVGIDNNQEYCQEHDINSPEDIVHTNLLNNQGHKAVINDSHVIEYVATNYKREAETVTERVRQSLLDDPHNIYFYSSNRNGSRQLHDRGCAVLEQIPDDKFRASNEIPDGYILCSQCKRNLLTRIGCYPSTKQIGICRRWLDKYRVSTTVLERAIDAGIRFHADDDRGITVDGIEDSWQIRVTGDRLSLWHNNYVKTSEKERYITDGFHQQNFTGSMAAMLAFIQNYTYEKHLLAKEIKSNDKQMESAPEELVDEQIPVETPKVPLLRRLLVFGISGK